MAKSLGQKLPQDLFKRLSSYDISTKIGERVILFTTADPDGWPRHGMLSHYEVVAKNHSLLLMLTYAGSKSTSNLLANGMAVLLFVDEEMSYYVRVSCKKYAEGSRVNAPRETLFECNVVDVMEDKLPTANIVSGLTFSGYDPGMPKEDRMRVRSRLIELAVGK
ncbi:MAG TPA: pyridoxamine 5'-phosphate oxidase family protein [Nitrososphaerales archaeon]|nr:pyridoxamine 5'-phosphate oxidase family protein [Nitrososphaerales archaeon]